MEATYRVGEIVKVKDLDTLQKELGNDRGRISAMCGWVSEMNKYAGKEYEITAVRFFSSASSASKIPYHSYILNCGEHWYFSEDVLTPLDQGIALTIDYDDAMGI